MHGYELSNFRKGKAFIHFDGVINGKADYGPRICINTKGEKLFELPDRDMIVNEFEDEDVAFVMDNQGKYALMNNKGEFLTEFIYNTICGGSEEGFFEVTRNGKHGQIDINGKEVVPCMYDDGCYFSEGVAAEYLNGKCGMVDCFNRIIIPFEYEEICVCKNNLINAKKNGKYGLINKNNEVVVDFQYDEIDCWCTRECTVYPARKGDMWGLIDRYNNVIEDFIYDDAQLISDNEDNAGEFIILLKDNLKAIYSTKKKRFITDFKYNFIGFFQEGRFMVSINNVDGFIDTEGNEITPIMYHDCHETFQEGVCAVYKDNKAGMINLDGQVVIPFEYDRLNFCCEGLIYARKGENEYFIDKHNNIVLTFSEDMHVHWCSRFKDGFVCVWTKDQGDVYIDKTGKILEIKI